METQRIEDSVIDVEELIQLFALRKTPDGTYPSPEDRIIAVEEIRDRLTELDNEADKAA